MKMSKDKKSQKIKSLTTRLTSPPPPAPPPPSPPSPPQPEMDLIELMCQIHSYSHFHFQPNSLLFTLPDELLDPSGGTKNKYGVRDHSAPEGGKIENKLTGAGINAKKCKNTSPITTKK